MIRAFEVRAIGTTAIVFATSRGNARYLTYRAANEAGYKIKFPDIEYARRRPEFDGVGKRGMCISYSYVKFLKQEQCLIENGAKTATT